MKTKIFAICILIAAFSAIGCNTTTNGTCNVTINKGAIEEGGFYTTFSPYRHSYELDLKTFTDQSQNVRVFTSDNTPILI